MSFLTELSDLLVANSFGTVNSDIFYGTKAAIPSGSGPFTNIIPTGGHRPDYVQNDAAPDLVYSSAQIVVRALSFSSAYQKAITAKTILASVKNQSLSSTWYLYIVNLNEPHDIGVDEVDRARCAFDILACKRPS